MNGPQPLLTPFQMGPYKLRNRVVMAPLTRMRSTMPGNIPGPINAAYYRQRASMGLTVTEATQISPQGYGYPGAPGIHSPRQVEGWKRVADAVHEKGGLIFLQLWHVGRVSHPSLQEGNALPVAPSAVKINGETLAADFSMVPAVTPRALKTKEIPGIVETYRQGALNARTAGFDGVEIHSANGYLIDQFLQDGTNQRTDAYGGSLENRSRFLMEVVEAAAGVWGGGPRRSQALASRHVQQYIGFGPGKTIYLCGGGPEPLRPGLPPLGGTSRHGRRKTRIVRRRAHH